MQEVYDFLKEAETYYLATVDGDQPRVRPFGTYVLFEGKLYIQTGKEKPVSKQMAANPKIEICAMLGEEWLRIEAEAVSDDRTEVQQAAMDQFPQLADYGYAVGDGSMDVLCLQNATATIASMVGEPKVIKF